MSSFEHSAPAREIRLTGGWFGVFLMIVGFLAIPVSVGLKNTTNLGTGALLSIGLGGSFLMLLGVPLGMAWQVFVHSRGYRNTRRRFLEERFFKTE